MRKVTIITGSLNKGGAERVSIHLSKYLNSQGWKCDILTVSKGDNEYNLPQEINRYVACEKNVNIFNMVWKVRKTVRGIAPDIILIMGTPLCSYIVPAIADLGIPYIVSERTSPTHFVGNKLNIFLARLFMRGAVGFVFQTNEVKEFYSEMLMGRGVVIANPLIIEELPRIYEGARENRIVTVGRLVKSKNHKLLIEAFCNVHKLYSEYSLWIYGEGSEREELQNYCKLLGVSDNVFMPGNVENVVQEIQKAKMFVLSSDYEGMPNALIEAMAVGMPSISTDCPSGGPRELITNNINGLLVKTNNLHEMTDAMIKYISDPEFAVKCGANAASIRNELKIDVIGAKWKAYIEDLMKWSN